MTMPVLPSPTLLSATWARAIRDLEQRLASAASDEQVGLYFDLMKHLHPLVDLTQEIAATKYGQTFRAGTSLRETLIISTAAQHHLEPEDPCITVSIERLEHGNLGFAILYYAGGNASENLQALVKTYGTDDHHVIETNLRRDLTNFYYPCEYADAWSTIQPLMVRLWNETHLELVR